MVKGFFLVSGGLFLYLAAIDLFRYWLLPVLWAGFCWFLAVYAAPAIRLDERFLHVKYWRCFHSIPWNRVLQVRQSPLGLQVLTSEPRWLYKLITYQFPMPSPKRLAAALEAHLRVRQ